MVYTWYIFSCHMPCLSMSYPCHKFVRLSGSGLQMKFSRKLHWGSSLAYHCTAFIKHKKIYLPPPRVWTPPLPPALGGDAAGAGSCAPSDHRLRGGRLRGGRLRGGRRRWGLLVAGGDLLAYGASWECEIVPGLSVPSLCSPRPCPALPRSTQRR